MDKIIKFWFPNNQFQNFWFDNTKDEYIINNFKDILENECSNNLVDIFLKMIDLILFLKIVMKRHYNMHYIF